MYPTVPNEMVANAAQMFCVISTAFVAVLAFMMTLRF